MLQRGSPCVSEISFCYIIPKHHHPN